MEIITVGGQRHISEGDAASPVSVDWAEALDASGQEPVPAEQLARLTQLLRDLEDVPDVSEVMACVVPASP